MQTVKAYCPMLSINELQRNVWAGIRKSPTAAKVFGHWSSSIVKLIFLESVGYIYANCQDYHSFALAWLASGNPNL